MGSDDPVLIETLYAFVAPIIEYRELAYVVRRNFALLSNNSRIHFGLMETASQVICSEDIVASMDPSIQYTPRVPGWRVKRLENPQRYWWQGISEDRLREATPFFLRTPPVNGDSLLTAVEFHETYHRIYRSGDAKLQQSLGLLANGFYGFTPATRPVLWRVCVILSLIYAAATGNSIFNAEDDDSSAVACLFQPRNVSLYPFECANDMQLYEDHHTTLRAARSYLAITCEPRIRAYLTFPREAA